MKRFLIFFLLLVGCTGWAFVKLHATALHQIESYLQKNTSYQIKYNDPSLKVSLGGFLFEAHNLKGISRATGNVEWVAEKVSARFHLSDLRVSSIIVNPIEIFTPTITIPTKESLVFEKDREPLEYAFNSFLWQNVSETEFLKINRSLFNVQGIRVYDAKLLFLNVDGKHSISGMRFGLLARRQEHAKQWSLEGQIKSEDERFTESLLFSGVWYLKDRHIELFLKTQKPLVDLKLDFFNPLRDASFDIKGKLRAFPIAKLRDILTQDNGESLFASEGILTLSFEGTGEGWNRKGLNLKGALDLREGSWQKENLAAEILQGYLRVDSLQKWAKIGQNGPLEPSKRWLIRKGTSFDLLQSRFTFLQERLELRDLRLKSEHYFLEGEAVLSAEDWRIDLQGRAAYMPTVSDLLLVEYAEFRDFWNASSKRIVIPYTYRGMLLDNASIRSVIPEDQLQPQTKTDLSELENSQEPENSKLMSVDDITAELEGV